MVARRAQSSSRSDRERRLALWPAPAVGRRCHAGSGIGVSRPDATCHSAFWNMAFSPWPRRSPSGGAFSLDLHFISLLSHLRLFDVAARLLALFSRNVCSRIRRGRRPRELRERARSLPAIQRRSGAEFRRARWQASARSRRERPAASTALGEHVLNSDQITYR